MKASIFSIKIAEWYQEHHRRLPWRETQDPYRIWLSEIILQQTRVAQGLPYFRAFLEKYPNVRSLAAANEQSVLRLWQGLGYYSRARNLHACAKAIVTSYGGKFPNTYEELKKLKGIGDYTAAAIASFAFDVPVAVVDGNVYRVLSRVFGIDADINSSEGRKKFRELANKLLPGKNASTHNQAIMEFGALHCTPLSPKCDECPLKRSCAAFQKGIQRELPVKSKPKPPVRRSFFYYVVRKGSKWMMKRRAGNDIWRGLWDFPLYESNSRTSLTELSRFLPKDLRKSSALSVSPVFRHVLTHQKIFARFVEINLKSKHPFKGESIFENGRFFSPDEISELPKPVLISRFLGERGLK